METLASELLGELKKSARRWFIIAMVELFAIVGLILFIFLVPAEVTEETTYTQGVEGIEESDITQQIGDIYGESNTDSY